MNEQNGILKANVRHPKCFLFVSVKCCRDIWNRQQLDEQSDQGQRLLFIADRENNRRCD